MSNKVPWYEMGEDVQDAVTMQDAMELGGLDFEVEKIQAYIPSRKIAQDGKLGDDAFPLFSSDDIVHVPGAFVNRRVDNGVPLGTVGSRYRVVQNTEAFELFDPLLSTGELSLKMAGCLGQHGEKIWVLAEVGDPVLLVPGDELKRYVVLLNSHDGSTAVKILNTPTSEVRGVIHVGGDRSLSIRHTSSVGDRLVKARKIVQRSLQFYENFTEAAKGLVAKRLQTIDVDRFIESLFPAKMEDGVPTFSTRARNQMQVIRDLYNGEQVAAARGTAWALYNAITEFVDHHRNPTDTTKQKYRRLQSVSVGSGAEMKKKAFKALVKKSA
jgi:phage/plasmid-like protein (TIGR03299 family)